MKERHEALKVLNSKASGLEKLIEENLIALEN
jgi:hypothetical protein